MGDLKYKVGDSVRIKSIDWYNANKNADGFVHCGDKVFDNYMSVFCGSIVNIGGVYPYNGYDIREDMNCRTWTDEMIEGLVEEETNDCEKCGLTRNSIRCLFMDNCPHNKQKNIIEIPKDYVIKDENGNVINATKIVLEKKKEYPKTYEECLSVLQIKGYDIVTYVPSWTAYEKTLCQQVLKLRELIICRDAYWKIAGEEMGLGNPWEPDFTNDDEERYGIYTAANKVVKDFCGVGDVNTILTFPTEEMRDAFFNAFRDDIENCKELI